MRQRQRLCHPLVRQACGAITLLLKIKRITGGLNHTLLLFPLCNEVCDTPTWSNQTPEPVCISSSARSRTHPHWSLAAAGGLETPGNCLFLYRWGNVGITNHMKWWILRAKWREARVEVLWVCVCVCLTVSPLIFLFVLKGLFSTAAACFTGVVHLFYSTQRTVLRSNAWLSVTLQQFNSLLRLYRCLTTTV